VTQRPTPRTRFAILGVLEMRPMSGTEIRRWLDDRIGNFWRESSGQLYPTLSTLTTQKLVRCSTRTGNVGRGRPGSEYAITAAGRSALAQWLAEPVTAEPRRIELLLKLFLSSNQSAHSLEHLARCRDEQRRLLSQYASIERELDQWADERPAETAKFRATVRYGVRVAEALLMWTDEAKELLTKAAAAEAALGHREIA